jgi:hypothetical protein
MKSDEILARKMEKYHLCTKLEAHLCGDSESFPGGLCPNGGKGKGGDECVQCWVSWAQREADEKE